MPTSSARAAARFSGLAILALMAAGASAAAVRVQFQGGKLSLNARDSSAAEVLTSVAQKTGVRFVVDSEIKPGSMTIDIEAMPLERAIHNLIAAIPQAAGHTMTYSPGKNGVPRLVQVTLFGPGKAAADSGSTVYAAPAATEDSGDATPASPQTLGASVPIVLATPNLDERMDKMIQAGVPRETAEKVIGLTREVQKLQATPVPGSYSPEDLSPAMREQLQPLIDRGVPMERAVQMLLLQERYQDTLKDLSQVPGGVNGVMIPTPSSGR